MKRARWMILLMALPALLAGCAAEEAALETVTDTVTPSAATAEPFRITVALPEDVAEETFAEGQDAHLYVQSDGDYEVYTDVMLDTGYEAALRELSGQDAGTLTVLKTERFGMPEYRTTWYSMSDEGGYVSRASVIYDGTSSYCVCFRAREEKAGALREQMDQVFASIGLYVQEF